MNVVAAAVLGLLLQTEPAAPKRRPELTWSGRVDLHHAVIGPEIHQARNVSPSQTADSFLAGRVSLRLDARVTETVSGVVELENQPYRNGSNIPFGNDMADGFLEQAYIDIVPAASSVRVRIGVQDVKLTLRPHDDAFFLDVSESESFSAGYLRLPGGTSIVATTLNRDLSETGGVRIFYDAGDFLSLQAYAGVTGSSSTEDRSGLVFAHANFCVPEHFSSFALLAWSIGDQKGGNVATAGLGVDAYLQRGLEVFAEGYMQFGRIDADTRKSAGAAQLGSRIWSGRAFVEAAFAFRSGDQDSGDSVDNTFQSYESVNRYLLVESAEFGLDWDTNVRSWRLALGLQSADLGGAFNDVTLRLDAGHFQFNEEISDGVTVIPDSDDRIGTEIDVSAAWAYDEALTFQVKAAGLFGSDILSQLTPGNDDRVFGVTAGAVLTF